jgi:predicted phosphodiesterase
MKKIIFILLILIILFFGCVENTDSNNPHDNNSILDNNHLINIEFEEFSIIVLPDTQKYSEKYPQLFYDQTNWIVENKEKLNIKFVIHEGDIVNKASEEEQWIVANTAMGALDGVIPYSVVRGNHDKSKLYQKYFGKERFEDYDWYLAGDEFNKNNISKLEINNKDFLFINLDVCPDENELAFIEEIILGEEFDFGILTTHGYLNEKTDRQVHVCGNTKYIWDFTKKIKNIRIMLCGHVHDEAMRTDPNDFNQDVVQMLADYQTRENGGNGYLRILKFIDINTINVTTYSPSLNKFEKDSNSEFSIELN